MVEASQSANPSPPCLRVFVGRWRLPFGEPAVSGFVPSPVGGPWGERQGEGLSRFHPKLKGESRRGPRRAGVPFRGFENPKRQMPQGRNPGAFAIKEETIETFVSLLGRPGNDLLSRNTRMQYHWRGGVSRPSSGWDRVQPPRNYHQASEGVRRNRQAFDARSVEHAKPLEVR